MILDRSNLTKALEAANFPSGERSIQVFIDMLTKFGFELVNKQKLDEIERLVIEQHRRTRDLTEARDGQMPALQGYAETIKTLRFQVEALQDRLRKYETI